MPLSDKEKQVLEWVLDAPEIKQYQYFIEDLLIKLKGPEKVKSELDVCESLFKCLKHYDRVGGMNEASFTQFLMNLPVFQYIVICPSTKREWTPWKESFSNFLNGEDPQKMLFVERNESEGISDQIFNWMIMLCSGPSEEMPLKSSSCISQKH